jgi:exonuclease III
MITELRKIKRDYPAYHMHHSSQAKPQTPGGGGAGGVMVLIKNHYAATLVNMEVINELAGHLVHITLPAPNSCIHIIGIYMPGDKPATQKKIYQYIQNQINNTKDLNHKFLIGGDWNAALYPTDRLTNTADSTLDQTHQTQCHTINMRPTRATTRTHTFHSYHDGLLHHSSRIDDFLLYPPSPENTHDEVCHEVGGSLDHLMLMQQIPATTFPMTSTPPKKPTKQTDQLILPISKQHLQQTHGQIESDLNPTFHHTTQHIGTLLDHCHTLLQGDYTPSNLTKLRMTLPNKQDLVTKAAQDIMTQLQAAMKIMINICPTKPPIKGHFLNRKVTKEYQQLNHTIKQIKTIRLATKHLNQDSNPQEIAELTHKLYQPTQPAKEATTILDSLPKDPQALTTWKKDLNTLIANTTQKLEEIRAQQKRDQKTLYEATFRANLSNRAKTVHRAIFNKNPGNNGPTTIKDKHGILHTDTEGILTLLTDHMAAMMAPTDHTKT